MRLAARAAPCRSRWVSRGEAGFVLEVPAVAALRLVPSAVTHCVDLVTGLGSFEDVGEFGAVREQCRSREVRVESSFAGPHFVTTTVVTAGRLFDESVQPRADIYGRRDDPPGHRNTLPPGTPSSA